MKALGMLCTVAMFSLLTACDGGSSSGSSSADGSVEFSAGATNVQGLATPESVSVVDK